MSGTLSFIFDMITDPLTLPIEAWKEWVILGGIGLIAYIMSFKIVGGMYAEGSVSGSAAAKVIHWTIRALIFIPMWFITYWAIVIGQWIQMNSILSLGILSGLAAFGVAAFFLIHWWRGKKRGNS